MGKDSLLLIQKCRAKKMKFPGIVSHWEQDELEKICQHKRSNVRR